MMQPRQFRAPAAPAPYVAQYAAPASPSELRRQSKDEPLVWDHICPDLVPELAAVIHYLEDAARGRSNASLNQGGWKSNDQLLHRSQFPVLAEFAQVLADVVGARPTLSWAMINRAGSLHKRHKHKGAVITTVYYVTAGDPLTPTIYECPDKSKVDVMPHPGRLVIAPGDMWHAVPQYIGAEPRITIVGEFRSVR